MDMRMIFPSGFLRNYLIVMTLAGCGSVTNAPIDASTPLDMAPLALDCATYCASAAVTASISVDSAKVFCASTANAPTGQCVGTASP